MSESPERDSGADREEGAAQRISRPSLVLATLQREQVDYLLVGGLAAQIHGHDRSTNDVDLIVEHSRENLERLGRALGSLDAKLAGMPEDLPSPDVSDRRTLDAISMLALTSRAGRIDVYIGTSALEGADTWERLRERSGRVDVAGTSVPYIGRDDLISLKRAAANSPTRAPEKAKLDRADVDVLSARREDIERAARQLRERKPPPAGPERGIDR